MRRYQKLIIICGLLLPHFLWAAENSPIGYWRVKDDVTRQPKSIIQIYQTANGLSGKVVKVFSESLVLPAVGTVIFKGLTPDANVWDHGKWMDAAKSNVFNCSLRLVHHGKKLIVRNYLGLPLLGRSQTWERVNSPV